MALYLAQGVLVSGCLQGRLITVAHLVKIVLAEVAYLAQKNIAILNIQFMAIVPLQLGQRHLMTTCICALSEILKYRVRVQTTSCGGILTLKSSLRDRSNLVQFRASFKALKAISILVMSKLRDSIATLAKGFNAIQFLQMVQVELTFSPVAF